MRIENPGHIANIGRHVPRVIPASEMDMRIIVYGSRYGTTKKYAEELSRVTGVPALSYEKVKDINVYEEIYYFGALYAGGVMGMKKTFLRLLDADSKKIIITTVGLADPQDEENVCAIERSMEKQLTPEIYQKAKIFHLRGGIDYERLGVVHMTMMAMLYEKAKKLPEKKMTADAKALVETYKKQVNFVDFRGLWPIIDACMHRSWQ